MPGTTAVWRGPFLAYPFMTLRHSMSTLFAPEQRGAPRSVDALPANFEARTPRSGRAIAAMSSSVMRCCGSGCAGIRFGRLLYAWGLAGARTASALGCSMSLCRSRAALTTTPRTDVCSGGLLGSPRSATSWKRLRHGSPRVQEPLERHRFMPNGVGRRQKLRPVPQAGTHPAAHLPDPRNRKAGRVRVHRDVPQPEA
jgi:hypothetical protein